MTVKTNITVSVDADLLRKAKVLAARRGTSVSRLVAEEFGRLVRQEAAYEIARRRALRRLEEGYDLGWSRPASRDELHGR